MEAFCEKTTLAIRCLEDLRGLEFEVGAFYWTVLAPGIVNSGREEQGSVSV